MSDRTSQVRRLLVAVAAVLGLVAAAGCGGGSADSVVDTAAVGSGAPSEVQAEAEEDPGVATQATAVPAEASLVATTVAGGQIDFGSLEGQDVVLWFWAPW